MFFFLKVKINRFRRERDGEKERERERERRKGMDKEWGNGESVWKWEEVREKRKIHTLIGKDVNIFMSMYILCTYVPYPFCA